MISQDSTALRSLNIDSRNRVSGVSQDFTFVLLEPVEKPRGRVSWVTDISLPTTWPNISENENILYISERMLFPLATTPTEKRFALPLEVGECNGAGLITKLQAALNNRTGTLFDAAVGYEVFSITAGQIGIRLLWNGSNVRYDYEGVYEDQNQELQFVSKNSNYLDSQTQQEFFVNNVLDFTSVAWQASSGEIVTFLHDSTIPPLATVAAGGTWTITAGAYAGGHLMTVDPNDPTRFDGISPTVFPDLMKLT